MFYNSDVEPVADISLFYKEENELKLPISVYLPDGFDESKKYPTVLVIHGGGWYAITSKSKDWKGGVMNHNAAYYRNKGYVAITISYRGINIAPETTASDLISDCNDALGFIKENFSFVDTDNMIFLGDSAGGHLVLSLCMELSGASPVKIMPRAVVACNPVTACMIEKWKYCAPTEEGRKNASPMDNIKKVSPSIFVIHGTSDGCVAISESREFTEKMKAAGNNITMEELEDTKHAFIVFKYRDSDEKVVSAHEKIDAFLDKVLQ